jgi:hypothetical protein
MTPETIPGDKALWERMCEYIRGVHRGEWNAHEIHERSRDLVAQLPTPVDPLVPRAREICAESMPELGADHFLPGEYDNSPMMRAVLAALREREAG